mmetsp:Transcript_11176/g.35488  ORF Transcript_11176/g.35488 Transcript_11176/m.35488 type:complete len:268 (+) Transcript_11176:537-1340(+)
MGDLANHGEDLRRVHDLLLEGHAVEGDDGNDNGVEDEGAVGEELVGGEGCDGVEEQHRGLLELSCRHVEEPLVHLEPVLPLPVTPLLEERLGPRDVLLHHHHVLDVQPEPEVAEHKVHLLPDRHGLLLRLSKCRHRLVLVPDSVQVRGQGELGLAHLALPKVLLRVLDLLLELLHLRRVGLLHALQLGLVQSPPQLLAEPRVHRRVVALDDDVEHLLLQSRLVHPHNVRGAQQESLLREHQQLLELHLGPIILRHCGYSGAVLPTTR